MNLSSIKEIVKQVVECISYREYEAEVEPIQNALVEMDAHDKVIININMVNFTAYNFNKVVTTVTRL